MSIKPYFYFFNIFTNVSDGIDLVVYPKNHPLRHKSQEESALKAGGILEWLEDYPKEKIVDVKKCILECSFSKGIIPDRSRRVTPVASRK